MDEGDFQENVVTKLSTLSAIVRNPLPYETTRTTSWEGGLHTDRMSSDHVWKPETSPYLI